VPKFRNEQDEREFWTTHDTTDYFEFSKSSRVEIEFHRGIEAPVKSISPRLSREMLNQLKVLANKQIFLTSRSLSLSGGKIAQERKASQILAYKTRMTKHSTLSRARRILWPAKQFTPDLTVPESVVSAFK
jgi:hypothetical protein